MGTVRIKLILVFVLAISFMLLPVIVSAEDTETKRFSIGFSAKTFVDVDIKDAAAAISIWGKEMADKKGLKGESYVYDNIDTLVRDFNNKKLDFVVLKSLEYLRIKGRVDYSLALSHIKGGKGTIKYLLLVNNDAHFDNIKDLRHKKLAILKEEDIGTLFLNTVLLRQKQPEMDTFFSFISYKTQPSQALLSVFFGQCDACLVGDETLKVMSELNPQIKVKLKILASSPELVEALSIFRRVLSDRYKNMIIDTGYKLKENTRGKQILLLFKLDGVYKTEEKDLDSLKKLISEYERLRHKK